MAETLLTDALVFVLAAVLFIGLFSALGLPAVVGYLAAGLIIGPSGLQLLEYGDLSSFLAELGLVLLMFMVGLEFSLPRLLSSRSAVLAGGGMQVGLTVLAVAAVTMLLGTDWRAALLLGSAVAMSSTAVSLKQLTEQRELGSDYGRLAVGVLLFQDLATLPFLLALALWQGESGGADALVLPVVTVVALILVVAVARGLFRRVLSWIARTNSADLFLLAILSLALGTAFIAHRVGMPPLIGAFLGGMVVGETDFRHQVADDLRPFRDVLLGVFFTTVGTQIDPRIVAMSPWLVLAWITAFIPGKALLIWLTGTLLRWRVGWRVRLAVTLAHGGEFGLLLLTQAAAAGIVGEELAQPALVALVITMSLAPLLIRHGGWFERAVERVRRSAGGGGHDVLTGAGAGLEDHVVICGCGRIGRLVAAALEVANLRYLAIEFDGVHFEEARDHGHHVVFGDAGRKSILDLARLGHAKLLIVTFDSSPHVERVLHCVRANGRIVPTLVSVADERRAAALAKLGATVIFPENLAAGLALAHQAFLQRGFSQDDAGRFISILRGKLNPELLGLVGR